MNRKNNKSEDIREDKKENRKSSRHKGGRMRNLSEALYMELREHKSSFIVYFTLRILVIVMLILQLLNRNYENVFLCALTLLLLIMPSLVQVTFKVELPTTLEIFILVFIFAAEILGEISVLSSISFLGYGAPHDQWVSCSSHRFLYGGSFEPE